MALAEGMHRARQLKCRACPGQFCAFRPGAWKWIRCEGATPAFDLDPTFMRDEASDCPMGYWADLVEVDLEQEAFEGRATWREGVTSGLVPPLRKFLDWLLTKTTIAAASPAIVDLCVGWTSPTWAIMRVLRDKDLDGQAVAFARGAIEGHKARSVELAQNTLLHIWEGGLLSTDEANQIKTDLGL